MIMPIITLDKYDTHEQMKKIIEEYNEFGREIPGSDKELDEALDLIQSVITYITHKHGQKRAIEAMQRHYNKILSRVDNRPYTVNSILNIAVSSKKTPQTNKYKKLL